MNRYINHTEIEKQPRGNQSTTGTLISVIIPVFNAERFLIRAIDSVLEQSHTNFELILSNDGSTDRSAEICNQYASNDRRVIVIHEKNGGPAAARNRAIAICKGEFIFFLDADDLVLPDALANLVNHQKENNCDIIAGDFLKEISGRQFESGHRKRFGTNTYLSTTEIRDYVTEKYLIQPNEYHLFSYVWGRLIRSSLIKKNNLNFDESLHYYEDVTFNFNLLKHTNSIFFFNRPVVLKIIEKHDGYNLGNQLKSANAWKQFGYIDALDHIAQYLNENNCTTDPIIEKKINTAFVVYTIVTLIRLCGYTNIKNWKSILFLIKRIIDNNRLQPGLSVYKPYGKNSRLIPFMLRNRLAFGLLIFCSLKSRLRYK